MSSWVTNFVSEMRTKSPAVVQRWVDSLPNETVTDIVPDDIAAATDADAAEIATDNNPDIHTDSRIVFDNTGNSCLENCENIIANKIECNRVNDIIKQVNELNVNANNVNVNVHKNEDDDNRDRDDDHDNKAISSLQASQEIGTCEKQQQQQQYSNNEAGGGINENANDERRFWQKGASVLTALRISRSTTSTTQSDLNRQNTIETQQDLNASLPKLSDSDTKEKQTSTSTKPIINKSKLNDIYHKLSINKKRYNFIKERRMDAKKLLNDAKSRLMAATNWDETDKPKSDQEISISNELMAGSIEQMENVANLAESTATTTTQITTETTPIDTTTATVTGTTTTATATTATTTTTTIISEPETSGAALAVCDTSDMDLSADELSSRLSQSNDILSADDEDSFNVPSIDSHHATHLNVNRRIVMADIGRSTSDNPRLRNKYYLADIGRSFSEHQDDDAIIIGDHRNISAPSSSIAIQNNNRSNGNFFERRAYSVSPTQRGLKRGILSRDHSLSDSSRHRNQLSKGSSFQSDSSHCSSVESLLDARKPDSEAILR